MPSPLSHAASTVAAAAATPPYTPSPLRNDSLTPPASRPLSRHSITRVPVPSSPASSESRPNTPELRSTTIGTSPGSSPRTPPRPRRAISRTATPTPTPALLRTAINTALPPAPPRAPPSTPSRRGTKRPLEEEEEVELDELTSVVVPLPVQRNEFLGSPFHDRHSIIVDTHPPDEDEPFELESAGSGSSGFELAERREKTMPGYRFAGGHSPITEKGDMHFGEALPIRPISEYRRSLYPSETPLPIPTRTFADHPDLLAPHTSSPSPLPPSHVLENTPLRPRFRRLFALSPTKDLVIHLLPAIILSVAASFVQPYMSLIIGDAFAIFTRYPLFTLEATEEERQALRDGVRDTSMKLALAGLYGVIFNYSKGVAWARHGEAIVARLREAVYVGVQGKSMQWFDMGMGMKAEEEEQQGESIGAGGLMAKFARETDDVRIGTSQVFGLAIQNFSTFLLCFILALVKSPVLAIVTLSTIPLVVLVQIITQVVCGPLYAAERRAFAEASTNVERATSAIATVKAHNAQKSEINRFNALIQRAAGVLGKQAIVWGVSIALTDFLLLGTFVVGFWYGAKVVRDGGSAGNVMTTFWACLLAASYLQSLVPQLSSLTKAKMSMASLLTIIQAECSSIPNPFSPVSTPTSGTFPRTSQARIQSIRKITPIRCHGEFNFQNVSFAYPSRADNLVLKDITLFLPPHETTFIVGGSGSGKSTIAQLLLQLYAPLGGEITLDDNSLPFLDAGFARQHIAAVSQGCILFDMSIHDNVAIGLSGAGPSSTTGITRRPGDVSRKEVEDACRMAMIHDFIVSLPGGYETRLGTGGSALSGGQKQRLAIARAKIRDPTVLILDEATSALDATSRVAVFENIKKWRQNRTTIVITHDLSQIVPDDFVYVMKDGIVAEQGFRSDLMKRSPLHGNPLGIFADMAAEQAIEPIPAKMDDTNSSVGEEEVEEILEGVERNSPGRQSRPHTPSFNMRPGSVMYLDILEEYSRGARFSVLDDKRASGRPLSNAQKRLSWAPTAMDRSPSRNSQTRSRTPSFAGGRNSFYGGGGGGGGSRNSMLVPNTPGSRMSRLSSHDSLRPTSTHFLTPPNAHTTSRHLTVPPHDFRKRTLSENLEDDLKAGQQLDIVVLPPLPGQNPTDDKGRLPGLFRLLAKYYPTLPRKYLLFIGVLGSLGHGISTPVWSFFLTKLMQIVGSGGTDPDLTKWALVVLCISAAQALAYFLQEYALAYCAVFWTSTIRDRAYRRVLMQNKAWFDESANDPARLVQILVKDADDMRALMGDVVGKVAVFVSMIGLGIVWAMVVGWRLTLIGVALAPIFGAIIMGNEVLIGRAEVRNKRKREVLAKTFYESVSNIRGIRAMALESTFRDQFTDNALAAKETGVNAGWVVSIGTAFSSGLPLFAMALMNFAGADFMLRNFMNYEQMLQVYNLVLFSLTFGTQALDFIPLLAKIKASARDFNRLYDLDEATGESTGDLRFPITGNVKFSKLSFAYPARPDVPIFTDLSFSLVPGECVAIVGPSGSGKSTIAALLQRLYDPSSGSIHLDKYDLATAEVRWLRDHIAVVSQTANLFDATVAENISYGSEVPLMEIHRAAKAANLHDFIVGLPDGYDTALGENAGLISGGQAQRLQIARALVRRSNILILDECTSALDVDNQRAIVETIVKIKDTRTVVFITHSVEAMKRCDRIICLGEGRVVEDGTFEELSRRGGVFAQLMKTDEWE